MHTKKLFKTAFFVFLFFMASTSPVLADQSLGDALNKMADDAGTVLKKTGSVIQDAAISGAITTKFMLDKNLSPYNIDTTSTDGVVKLVGEVNSQNEVNNAIAIAMATNGVKSVDASKLIIKKSDQPVADLAITTKIKTLYLKEKLFGDLDLSSNNVTVETKNGIVYLGGTTENPDQAAKAVKLAESVSGVIKVVTTIIVVKKE